MQLQLELLDLMSDIQRVSLEKEEEENKEVAAEDLDLDSGPGLRPGLLYFHMNH